MTATVIQSTERPHFPSGAALVVGGSGGIGQACCERLAVHGANVALTYRNNRAAAEHALGLVTAAGRKGHAASVDLVDAAAVKQVVDEVAEQFGALHTVVFAMGGDISMSMVSEIDPEEWYRTIEGDLNGFFHVVRAAIPHLRQAGGGAIVAMTSAGLMRHPPRDILSTAPKAGIEALVRGIAREEGRYGIRANSIALGVIDAGLFHRLAERLPDGFVDAMKRNTALRRFGSAREAADLAVFLSSSVSTFITGQSIAIDGGYAV